MNNHADKLKFLRNAAKLNGMVFRRVNANYNGKQGYSLFNRTNGQRVTENVYTLQQAFEFEQYSNFMADVAIAKGVK